ncbi:MAG: hypothetical protein IGQ88_09715 [Gloeomargaritaceae cyanobacterium C42_A2020_066]|nr:hypothetical protein [Gloeomargaritaceae cyanobacterium C42_A2020_066]
MEVSPSGELAAEDQARLDRFQRTIDRILADGCVSRQELLDLRATLSQTNSLGHLPVELARTATARYMELMAQVNQGQVLMED